MSSTRGVAYEISCLTDDFSPQRKAKAGDRDEMEWLESTNENYKFANKKILPASQMS